VERLELDRRVLRELGKPSSAVKARLALVANLLRPGKSIQVSIDDNEWLGQQGMQTSMVVAFVDFLRGVGAVP
jgi:hypothetical protein